MRQSRTPDPGHFHRIIPSWSPARQNVRFPSENDGELESCPRNFFFTRRNKLFYYLPVVGSAARFPGDKTVLYRFGNF